MSLDEREHLENLLKIHTKNAEKLQTQLANFGLQKPLHIVNELESEHTHIESLRRQLNPNDTPKHPASDLQFINQLEALNAVLSQSQANNFVIDAPPGYGKSRLLKELAVRLAQVGWHTRTISFSESHIKPMKQHEAINFIVQHFNVKYTDDPGGMGRRVAHYLHRPRLKNAPEDGYIGSVLILDSIEQVITEKPTDSYGELRKFLDGLREGSGVFHKYTLRIILAGRYISQYISIPGNSIIISLKPFDLSIIRQAINAFFESHGSEMSFERCGDLAQHILYITGGHPEMVKKILADEDIGIFHHQTIDLQKWRTLYLNDIRSRIVKPTIEDIRSYLPEKLWNVIEIFCVFRRIHRYMIKQLLSQEITEYTTHFELIDDLKKARLIKHVGSYFEDGILRPAIVRWLQFSDPDRFMKYCQIAYTMFVSQLHIPPEGTTRAYFLKELLYIALIQRHSIALTLDENVRLANFHAVRAMMIEHIQHLLDGGLDRDELEDLFDDLLNSLQSDAELAFLFDYTFGPTQSYVDFIHTICNADTFKR